MNKRKVIIIVVLLVVIVGGGVGAYFYFKKPAAAAPPGSAGSVPPVPGSGYQSLPAPAGSVTTSLEAQVKARTWRNQNGATINLANDLVGVRQDGSVQHRNSAWTGQLVRNGTQINWQHTSGQRDIWYAS